MGRILLSLKEITGICQVLKARVRLSAGRRQLGEGIQTLCYLAGANSIFYGDKLLVTGNPEVEDDRALLNRLGIHGKS